MDSEYKPSLSDREIEAVGREFIAGDYNVTEHAAALDSIIARYGVKTEVIAEYANGIQKIRVTDTQGAIVAEFHRGKPKPE